MKHIILNYFESVYSLESFLLEVKCKMSSSTDEERLKSLLKNNFQSILIAFDFHFKGPFKSYIDKRYSYEQLLLLCHLKVQETQLPFYENHMFKQGSKFFTNNKRDDTLNLSHFNLSNLELEKKLAATENLSICYFLSKEKAWRELHSLIGSSIMKYLIIYSFMFERLTNGQDIYIQISGCKFTAVYKTLVAQKLKIAEEFAKNKNLNKKCDETNVDLKQVNDAKKIKLIEVFENKEVELNKCVNDAKSVNFQLKSLGQSTLNKTVMLYNRNLGPHISPMFIYSDKKLKQNEDAANKIISQFILKNVNLELYPHDKQDLNLMKEILSKILVKFIEKFHSCPFQVFRSCFCKGKESSSCTGAKRKRDKLDTTKSSNNLPRQASLENSVDAKKVYCFLRRCLMHIFDYVDKPDKIDLTCPILGGKSNFNLWIKKLRQLISGLKFDKICLNGFLHGLKFARISYLQPLKCDKYKRLILLGVNRWLIEDLALMIVRASFFVTDTSKTNSNLFYYLKSDWRNIVRSQLSDPVSKKYRREYNLEKIRESDVVGYCSRYEAFGYYLGRLLPKNVGNECRIISGCRIFNPCYKRYARSNFKFITLNNCLKWLIQNDPSLIGFACVNHQDIQQKYAQFLNLNKMCRINEPGLDCLKKWNFMKFDIQKCFDSINIDQLIDYLGNLFCSVLNIDSVFTLISYSVIKYDMDRKQLQNKRFHLTLKHHLHEKGFLNGISDFIRLMSQTNLNRRVEQIIVPQSIHERNVNTKTLRNSLNKCLKHVIIKIHDEIYERVNGILQGSNCSRNLCDLYLGRIERKLFKHMDLANKVNMVNDLNQAPMLLHPANDLILRIVDDYIVICADSARMFKINGLLKTELKLNEKKTVVFLSSTIKESKIKQSTFNQLNYEVTDDGLSVAGLNLLTNYSNEYFSWCGFDFDVRTLDIYFNYDKYFLTNNSTQNRINYANNYQYAFSTFNLKFLRLFSMNTSNLIIDTRINSIQGILRNYADVFGVSVVRFSILSQQMPSQLNVNINLQLKVILNACYLFDNKISTSLKNLLVDYFYSSLTLSKFICFKVYSIILPKINKIKYNKLIRLINFKLKKLEFQNCIKSHKEYYFFQLNKIIDQQVVKFFDCVM